MIRYYIKDDPFLDLFEVRDGKKEGQLICWCKVKGHADLIVETLNKAWIDIENADRAAEIGG